MFQLAIIEDKITCLPDQLNRDPAEVIIEQIELKYCNKVLLNVGLGISFYDFISIGDPYLYPGAGSSIQVVTFRLVVFRPFVGEVLIGKVLSSNKDGIKLTMDFFDDIFIPFAHLQQPSQFNTALNVWTWKYETDGDAEYALQPGDEVRFKVRTISFTELISSAKGLTATTTTSESNDSHPLQKTDSVRGTNSSTSTMEIVPPVRKRSSSFGLSPESEIPSAMQITGSMNDFGLGCTSWW